MRGSRTRTSAQTGAGKIAYNGLGYVGGRMMFGSGAGRVFWTGGSQSVATNFAVNTGMRTIGMTNAGKVMSRLDPYFSESISRFGWSKLSAGFANTTTGSATVFFGNSTMKIGTKAIWKTTEFPILQSRGIELIYKMGF